jgi:hypothetical protein
MSDDDKEGLVKSIINALPLKEFYADAISPGAKVAGQIGEDLLKAIQIALAPVQLAGVGQDRFRRFIDKSRNRVSPEMQVLPAPQIIGPILEGIRYEPEDTPVDEMFSQLLSSAMDKKRMENAHPAFVEIIKQLSSDEAILLVALSVRPRRHHFRVPYDSEKQVWGGPSEIGLDERPTELLSMPTNFDLYVTHLFNLGLAEYRNWKREEPEFADIPAQPPRVHIGTRVYRELKLTEWGTAFMNACADTKR